MPLQTARKDLLLLNTYHMNQSKINAGGINQQPMHAVTAAFANSININLQSIFKQYTKHQQLMCSVSTANAHSTRLPYARFLQSEYFHFSQYVSHSCHSARSRRRSRRIHPARKYPFQGFVEGSSLKILLALRGNIFSTSKNPLPQGEGGPLAVGEGDDSIKVDQLFYRKCIPT